LIRERHEKKPELYWGQGQNQEKQWSDRGAKVQGRNKKKGHGLGTAAGGVVEDDEETFWGGSQWFKNTVGLKKVGGGGGGRCISYAGKAKKKSMNGGKKFPRG